MGRLPDPGTGHVEFVALDPCRYVREADQALRGGRREQAVSLIAQAYLAFDLVSADCERFMAAGRAWSGRSSRALHP
jgi:hypothetical protein